MNLNNVMSHELVELMTAGIELLMKHLLTSTLYNLEQIARDVSGETSLAAKSEEKRMFSQAIGHFLWVEQ